MCIRETRSAEAKCVCVCVCALLELQLLSVTEFFELLYGGVEVARR